MTGNTPADSSAFVTDPRQLNRPLAFVLDVQTRFEPDRKERYQSFLRSFTEYQTAMTGTESASDRDKSLSTLRDKVSHLLRDDADLLSEFESFFPQKETEKGGQQP